MSSVRTRETDRSSCLSYLSIRARSIQSALIRKTLLLYSITIETSLVYLLDPHLVILNQAEE